MIERIIGEVPNWTKRDNPLLRYELARHDVPSSSAYGRIVMWVIILTVLVLGGYVYATDGLQRSLQMPYSLDIWRIIVFPLFALQLIFRVAGLSLGVGAVSDERQRQTWDNLRATERGAEISLRTRWVSVFYRLRGLVFTILASRLILIGAIFYELTSMQGEYLSFLTARADPSVSLQVGVILLGMFLTAFILMPITATGVDIALGLYISTNIRNRALSSLAQVLLIVFRVVTSLGLFWMTWQFVMVDSSIQDTSSGLALISASAILGDWGLMLAQLSKTVEIWADVPYTVFIGTLMLIMVIVQMSIVSGLLMLSVRSAEIRE